LHIVRASGVHAHVRMFTRAHIATTERESLHRGVGSMRLITQLSSCRHETDRSRAHLFSTEIFRRNEIDWNWKRYSN